MSHSLVVISGMSGAGKSSALRAFEDLGYYCVDNLPPQLMRTFVDLCERSGPELSRAALAVDARTATFLDDFAAAWEMIRAARPDARLLFFDADERVLAQRFSETRRPHPVDSDEGVAGSIQRERELLAPLRELSDEVIDTTEFNVRTLRDSLLSKFSEGKERELNVTVASFGFRRGVPKNVDLVFDVRFLPNPHYDLELRPQTGLDAPVRDFVESQPATQEFLDHLQGMLRFLVPQYVAEGKTYLTLAFGCTGGRHRSVAMACMVSQILAEQGVATSVRHIDLEASEGRARR